MFSIKKKLVPSLVISIILLALSFSIKSGSGESDEFKYLRPSPSRIIDSTGDNDHWIIPFLGRCERTVLDPTLVWKAIMFEFYIPDGFFPNGMAFVTNAYNHQGTIPTYISIMNNTYYLPNVTWIDIGNINFSTNHTYYNVNANSRLIIYKIPRSINGTLKLLLEPANNCTPYSYFTIYDTPASSIYININEDAIYIPPILCGLDENGDLIYPSTTVEDTIDDTNDDVNDFMGNNGAAIIVMIIAAAVFIILMKRKR